jgi:plastocyanin
MHLAAQRTFSVRPMLFAAALTLALAACSSNASSSVQSAGASGGTVVKISGLAYDPPSLTIKAGTTVTFQNNDTVAHTLTNGKDGKPDANPLFDKDLPIGASDSVTFSTAGTFNVTCKIHSSMNMTITVQ